MSRKNFCRLKNANLFAKLEKLKVISFELMRQIRPLTQAVLT